MVLGWVICVVTAIIILGILFKIYKKLTTRWNNTYTCLIGKTVIVTGANTGIGYVTALDFAMRGGRVILACRDPERANKARSKIVAATGNENVIVKIIDMASYDSVRAFAKDINETEGRIDILVNNAGLYCYSDSRTTNGLLVAMQVNHLSPFLLTHLLLNKIKSTPASRIVNVSSFMAKRGNLQPDQIDTYPSTSEFMANMTVYSNTKLCNLLFSIELAKKLQDGEVRVYCVDPGSTQTDIGRYITGFQKKMFKISELFFWSAEEGAQTTIYCSLSKDVEGSEGEMFSNCKRIGVYGNAKDVTLAKAIWRKSEELAKLTEAEKIKSI